MGRKFFFAMPHGQVQPLPLHSAMQNPRRSFLSAVPHLPCHNCSFPYSVHRSDLPCPYLYDRLQRSQRLILLVVINPIYKHYGGVISINRCNGFASERPDELEGGVE